MKKSVRTSLTCGLKSVTSCYHGLHTFLHLRALEFQRSKNILTFYQTSGTVTSARSRGCSSVVASVKALSFGIFYILRIVRRIVSGFGQSSLACLIILCILPLHLWLRCAFRLLRAGVE